MAAFQAHPPACPPPPRYWNASLARSVPSLPCMYSEFGGCVLAACFVRWLARKTPRSFRSMAQLRGASRLAVACAVLFFIFVPLRSVSAGQDAAPGPRRLLISECDETCSPFAVVFLPTGRLKCCSERRVLDETSFCVYGHDALNAVTRVWWHTAEDAIPRPTVLFPRLVLLLLRPAVARSGCSCM